MLSLRPLNPWLYSALQAVFGPVTIANQGIPFNAVPVDVLNLRRLGAATRGLQLQIREFGESYRVNCPDCGDTRQRLYFCHRWGEYDQWTRKRNLYLIHCFNEHCHEGKAWEWYQLLKTQAVSLVRTAPAPQTVISAPSAPVTLPKDFRQLKDLAEDHQAVEYVRSRRFKPGGLSTKWGVGYSNAARFRSSSGRLLIPTLNADGELLGWQARAIASDDSPKYLTSKGFKKSQALYGLQHVADSGPVAVVEGVTDVWRLGGNAVALFGKDASSSQRDQLVKRFRGRKLVIMLDPDAAAEANELAKRLHEARANSIWRPDSSSVCIADLPAGVDPGDLRRRQLQALIAEAKPYRP